MSTSSRTANRVSGPRRRAVTLLLTASVLVGSSVLAAAPAQAAGLGCEVDSGWATMNDAWATEVIALTNAHRATLGLAPLVQSRSLTEAAEWKAAHMANFGYMAHDDPAPPVGRTWDERIEDCGYYYGMGENIAFGYRSPAAVVAGWIGSSGHRRNIEDPDFKVIGVGAALDGDDTPYWAQTFGTHRDSGDGGTGSVSAPVTETVVSTPEIDSPAETVETDADVLTDAGSPDITTVPSTEPTAADDSTETAAGSDRWTIHARRRSTWPQGWARAWRIGNCQAIRWCFR